MGLKNKKRDMTPFDMGRRPCRQCAALLPVIWGASYIATRRFGLRISRPGMEKLEPPYVVLSTHQGFSDYYIAPLALFPHRASYVSDMEGFAAFGLGLYRRIGCIGKRRFVPDPSVIKNCLHVLRKNKDILVLFPESRHSNAGVTSPLPKNLGRLCKLLDVPVVTLSVHGSYLANPFWDETHTRKVKMEASLEPLYDRDMLRSASAEEVQSAIEDRLSYDEYAWQRENNIKIKGERLAEGLHKALYQCLSCGEEFSTETRGNILRCRACGAKWTMDENGVLLSQNGAVSVLEWYLRQRESTERELAAGKYGAAFDVSVEALPNEKGFVPLGSGRLVHDAEGFCLSVSEKTLFFPSKAMESVQTEYDYRGRGPCIVLSKPDCCYYVYSGDPGFCPTKIQFAAEYAHKLKMER